MLDQPRSLADRQCRTGSRQSIPAQVSGLRSMKTWLDYISIRSLRLFQQEVNPYIIRKPFVVFLKNTM